MHRVTETRADWSPSRRYAASIAIFLVALGIRFLILPVEAGLAFLTFYPATVLAFYLCGPLAAWWMVILAAAAGYFIFSPPYWSLESSRAGVLSTAVYLASAAMIAWVLSRLRETSQRLRGAFVDLHRTEQRYRAVLEAQTDAIVRLAADQTITFVNSAYCRLFGIASEALIGSHWLSSIHSEDASAATAALDSLSSSKPQTDVELRYLVKDQGIRWFNVVILATFDDAENLVETQAVGRDIHDAKVVEARLAAASAELTDLYEHAPCGYFSLDAQGRFVRINATMLSWLACGRDDVIAKLGPVDFFSAADQAQFHQNFPRFIAQGQIDGLMFGLQSRDGTVREVSVSATAIYDEQGRLDRSRSVMYDVTELRRTQDHLSRLVREQQVMLDNDLVAIVRLRDRRAVWVNRGMSRIFGYEIEELLEQPSRMLYPDESTWTTFGEAAYRELRLHGRHRAQVSMVHKDGTPLWIDASGALLSVETGESMWLLVDMTAIQSAKVEVERALDHAEQATRAKSAFLANMSHEIRTPMNAIIGLAHLMTRDSRDAVELDRLNKVSDAAMHLLRVINDILDLSKIEAGKMVLDDVEFSLDQVLSSALQMVSGRASEKGLELVLDVDHLPDRLRGDPTRLEQMLINLLANAVKFTASGWIRLRGEWLREVDGRAEVRFEVQDTGQGVDAESQIKLFQAFEQGDSSASRTHGGTGLGLALTRHLASMMGGEVGMASAPGKGSTFWFTARLSRAAVAGDRAAPVPLQGLRVLLVDDLPEARQALTDCFCSLGMQVDAVEGGAAALARASSALKAGRPFDAMVIDWRMKPMDGIETLRRLNELLGAGRPPAILVTAFDNTPMWQQSRSVHYDAVLVKPVTGSMLQQALSRLLRRQPGQTSPLPGVPDPTDELRHRHAGQRVLLAEDNPVNREIALEMLTSAGLVVETASDGQRALQMAQTRSYDVILMDVQMPHMDGLSATRAIRERSGRGTPIIAITANAFAEDRAAAEAAGMNDYIVKPFRPEVLYGTLLRWLPLRDSANDGDGTATAAGFAPIEDQRPLKQRLASVAELDVATALDHCGGQEVTLRRALVCFASAYRAGEPALLQAHDDGADPVPVWLAKCHSMRGACASIGASPLVLRIQAFEARLRAGGPGVSLAEEARAVDRAMSDLSATLIAVLGRDPVGGPSGVTARPSHQPG